MRTVTVYIAGSFRHVHGVRLLSRELRRLGYKLFDWTEEAKPPEGLSAQERRVWMDTDHGGEVFVFCAMACRTADLVIYYGESGQDAGVEVGMALAAGIPVLGIRGPLESPGLMLYGAADLWVDTIDVALVVLSNIQHDLPSKTRSMPAIDADGLRTCMKAMLHELRDSMGV